MLLGVWKTAHVHVDMCTLRKTAHMRVGVCTLRKTAHMRVGVCTLRKTAHTRVGVCTLRKTWARRGPSRSPVAPSPRDCTSRSEAQADCELRACQRRPLHTYLLDKTGRPNGSRHSEKPD